ncbi:hypothetical protein [Metarhizobium album]|nr:hypothetical protein [Rhizobium album]
MRNELEAYRGQQVTVHSWSNGVRNRKFKTLELALGYCRHHIADLSSIEVFVHGECTADSIISGIQLEALVERG